MPTNPTRSILGCSCARTAGGHAAAAPTSSVMKSRRRIWIAMCPSVGGHVHAMEGPYHVLSVRSVTTSRSGAPPGARVKQGVFGHRCPVSVVRLEASRVQRCNGMAHDLCCASPCEGDVLGARLSQRTCLGLVPQTCGCHEQAVTVATGWY